MWERVDSFYNDVIYDEVMKMHYIQLCALDQRAFNLKILCQRKHVNTKLANSTPTLTLY